MPRRKTVVGNAPYRVRLARIAEGVILPHHSGPDKAKPPSFTDHSRSRKKLNKTCPPLDTRQPGNSPRQMQPRENLDSDPRAGGLFWPASAHKETRLGVSPGKQRQYQDNRRIESACANG